MTDTRTYYAVSILTSRTFWAAVLTVGIGLLAEPEVLALIPLSWLPRLVIGIGLANMVLRKLTVRPVSFIAPGTVLPVEVTAIGPPKPAPITD